MEGSIHHTCSSAHSTRAVKWLTLVWLVTAAAAEDQCDGPLLQLQLHNSTDAPPRTLYGVLATFGGIPLFNATEPAQLIAAEPLNACGPLPETQGADVAQLSMRARLAFVWFSPRQRLCPPAPLVSHKQCLVSLLCCCACTASCASRRGLPGGAWQLLFR